MEKKKTKELESVELLIDGKRARVTLVNSINKKRMDKLNSMKIALTYIESQNLKATPEKTIKIADEFLEWLEK